MMASGPVLEELIALRRDVAAVADRVQQLCAEASAVRRELARAVIPGKGRSPATRDP